MLEIFLLECKYIEHMELFPLGFELAVELCFPVGEAIVAGMLVTGG